MPTQEEWTRVHADLMAKLRLPCKLRFSPEVKIGCHTLEEYEDGVECYTNLALTVKNAKKLIADIGSGQKPGYRSTIMSTASVSGSIADS